ncbi:TniQ family protein [Pelomonas sp. Root1237]|uniref:TniQ family protein n=1 Tax=Pelomonas sp. Root1237 TaxID=1736434 RepID=UPI0009EA37F9
MSIGRILQHGVPQPADDESPASWLSRLALAQGCSLPELLNFLGLRIEPYADLSFFGLTLTELRWKCGLPASAFLAADRAMTRLARAQLGPDVIFRPAAPTPAFRYCPLCFGERQPPTFPIHWRFLDWRYCPSHCCLMEENCWRCGRLLWYPLDMAETRAGRNGYASQRRCLSCMADLSEAKPCSVDPDRSSVLSPIEAHWLRAGCGLVKALCRPLSDSDIPAEVQRSFELNSLPSTGQWKQLELRLRSQGGINGGDALAAPLTYSRLRSSWAGRVFDFHCRAPCTSAASGARDRPLGVRVFAAE